MSMAKTINWTLEAERAELKTNDELFYAIKDAQKCVAIGLDDGFYCDQISVYRALLKKRGIPCGI